MMFAQALHVTYFPICVLCGCHDLIQGEYFRIRKDISIGKGTETTIVLAVLNPVIQKHSHWLQQALWPS